ncbi:MAG TPA: glutaminyl-peptide cyclotransferase [Herpetosiphonaceae bacterium]|nr:glutaminyl-peptide cyclotransferase [Herpetosiphonaceae bacterium]
MIISFRRRCQQAGALLILTAILAACGASGDSPGTTQAAAPTIQPTAASPATVAATATAGPPPVLSYKVINTYPHDPTAFTQGLEIDDGVLYEGTGLEGQSTLRTVDLETGAVLKLHKLPDTVFGEGITVYGDTIVQLTWQSGIGYVYDRASFALRREWQYPTEGWGLTNDGQRLIMSDGTAQLSFRDLETMEEIGRVEVRADGQPVPMLNELEFIDGKVYANIWQTDRIAQIDPASGQVVAWIDLSGLLSEEDRRQPVDVLNGIAYDASADRLFVTGKLWPKLFEIELVGP